MGVEHPSIGLLGVQHRPDWNTAQIGIIDLRLKKLHLIF